MYHIIISKPKWSNRHLIKPPKIWELKTYFPLKEKRRNYNPLLRIRNLGKAAVKNMFYLFKKKKKKKKKKKEWGCFFPSKGSTFISIWIYRQSFKNPKWVLYHIYSAELIISFLYFGSLVSTKIHKLQSCCFKILNLEKPFFISYIYICVCLFI